jgi:FdhD protein
VARADLLATEEPLGIRVDGSALTVTMHTPGDDVELAAGFLVGEAVVRSHDDIAETRLCDGTSCGRGGHDGMGNVADVVLAPGVEVRSGARRNFMTTCACGVCGKTSIEDICALPATSLESDRTQFSPSLLASLPDRLRQAQLGRVGAETVHGVAVRPGHPELLGHARDAPCCDVFELTDGKIKRFDCYPEGSIILTQLGVIGNLSAALEQ